MRTSRRRQQYAERAGSIAIIIHVGVNKPPHTSASVDLGMAINVAQFTDSGILG